MARRIFFFILTNILVLVTISVVTSVLGIGSYLTAKGIDYRALLVFCGLWGMGGAFVSLWLSKHMAKWMMKVQIIDETTRDPAAAELVQTVHRLARSAGLEKMPQVGVYPSPEVNAFATGPSKNSSLVAVSAGLLQRMNRQELEGVLGHEVAHIANGDMVTMTLIQGVINAFVMFFARIAAHVVSSFMQGDEEEGPGYFVYFGLVILFDILFGILGSMVVCYFSRIREFRADRGGAQYAGRDRMISALESLKRTTQLVDTGEKAFQSLKIAGGRKTLAGLFMTHPSLDDRIHRLRTYTNVAA